MTRTAGGGVRLLPPAAARAAPEPDGAQAAAIALPQGSGPVLLLGAPGSGRTTTLVALVLARVRRDGVPADGVLVLAPTRAAAADLRGRITSSLGRTLREPVARTPHSYAFGLLRRAAVLDGDLPPRLISGPEQDRILADLLAGHEEGFGAVPTWPAHIGPAVRGLRAFRGELRDLLMRSAERGIGPEHLDELGRRHGRPEWVAAAEVYAEYLDVTSLATPGAFDPAALVDAGARLLATDPGLLAAERDRVRLLVVDDAQELTSAGARLVRLLGAGRDLVLAGDPDAAVQGFRGARPRLLGDLAQELAARRIVLPAVHRHGAAVRSVAQRVTAAIGSSGVVEHRRAGAAGAGSAGPDGAGGPGGAGGRVEAHVLASAAQEAAFVAQLLRREHLDGGVPWARMAVVVRSMSATAPIRRALAAAGVPVAVPAAELPLRDEPAVVPLRLALRCVLDPRALTPEVVVELLTGPLGGADTLGLRRLRQRLRARELAAGGTRRSDELLVELVAALDDPGDSDPADSDGPGVGDDPDDEGAARRVAGVLRAGQAALAGAEPGGGAEAVLWAMWSASGLGPVWRDRALAGGAAGQRADRDLDAVVALFEAAARFTDRLPHAKAEVFLDYLEGQDLPADTLAARAPSGDAVTLVTATGSAGLEWDVVAVPGVQEGTWPDLRLRSSLLGAQHLADLHDHGLPPDAQGQRRAVWDDELRLFLVAITRARRTLVVTAVRSEDALPSPLLDLVAEPDQGERPITDVPRAMTLPALVAELRGVVTAPDGAGEPAAATQRQRRLAAVQLARLAAAGVPGAHPDDWFGLAGLSSDDPLHPPGAPVPVSPSKVEAFGRCPLRWLLDTSGGGRPAGVHQNLGTLVHEIAEAVPSGDRDQTQALLDVRFAELGLPPGWVADIHRERAERMLDRFAGYVQGSGRALVGTEEEIRARVGRADIRGSIDRLERDADGRLVVVDLKTGVGKPTAADLRHHPQLGTYQLAVEQAGKVSGGAELVQLGATGPAVQAQRPLADDADPGWARELVESVAEGMAGREFPATTGPHCRRCAVRTSCPAQLEGRGVVG